MAQSTQQMNLKKSVSEVKSVSTFYAASMKFSIPEETVRRCIVKSLSHQGSGRSCNKWTRNCIVVALQFLGKCGFPLIEEML